MPRLICTHGNNAEEVFAIREGVNRVGRCPSTAIKVFDKACSRAHAEIYRKGDYIAIEDLGSRHGTFVNGKRIAHRIKLHVGDRVDIGHTVLKICEGEAVPASKGAREVPPAEVKTQEISERLLVDELEKMKRRQEQPKVNLFRRLFGGVGANAAEGASGSDEASAVSAADETDATARPHGVDDTTATREFVAASEAGDRTDAASRRHDADDTSPTSEFAAAPETGDVIDSASETREIPSGGPGAADDQGK